jgi:hypothetical protein
MGGLRKLRRTGAERYAVEPLRGDLEPQPWKLSTVILEFARPLRDRFPDDRDFEVVVELAIICWNLALFPEAEQKQELQSLLKEMAKGPADLAGEIQTWVKTLVDRKKALFGRDRRMVVSHTIVQEGDNRHVYVASTLVPPSPASSH